MRRIQSVLVLCVAFLSVAIGPQSSIAGPYSTTEVLPVHTWSGLYLGANLGGAWGSTTAYDNNGVNAASDYWSWAPSGFTGGVQLGYNWQLGPVLYGLEGDLGELGLGGSATQAYVPFIYNTSTGTDIDFYLTLRGRLGILFNQSLLYATFGYIGADTTASVVTACTFPPCTVAVNAQNESFRNGWTVGGGFETGHQRAVDREARVSLLRLWLGQRVWRLEREHVLVDARYRRQPRARRPQLSIRLLERVLEQRNAARAVSPVSR